MDASLPAPLLPRLDCDVAVLRPWRLDDLDSLVASANDDSVSRGLRERFPYPYGGDDGRAWLARAAGEFDRAWALELDGHAVGGIGLHPDGDRHRRSAELGYWLAQRLWNRGVMTKVVAAFAPRAMEVFGLHRLHAIVYEGNPGSVRVLEKCGFVLEDKQRSAVAEHGRPLEIHRYARTRQEAGSDA